MRIYIIIFVSAFICLMTFTTVQAQNAGQALVDYTNENLTEGTPDFAFGLAIGEKICQGLIDTPDKTPEQNDLLAQCGAMVGAATNNPDGDAALNDTLSAVSSDKVAVQGVNSIKASQSNISSRLAALRGGATGISIQGLTMDFGGQKVPLKNYNTTNNTQYRQYRTETEVASTDFPLSFLLANQVEGDNLNLPSIDERFGIFINGLFTFGDKDGTKREAGFDFHGIGITGGADYRFTDYLVLGGAFSYTYSGVDIDSNGGNLDSNGYNFSIYGSTYFLENFYIDGILTIGWINYDQKRRIEYDLGPGADVNQTAKSDFDATQYAFSFSTGYDFRFNGFTIGPFGQLNYIKANIDGYRERINVEEGESKAGFGLALNIKDQDAKSLTSVLGVNTSYAYSTNFGVLLPQVLFGWVHEYENDSRIINATFINGGVNNIPILVPTDNPDRDYFDLGLSLSAQLPHGVSSFVYYQTSLAYRDLSIHSFLGGIRLNM